ncbi:dynein regulatory complex protein 1 [Passerculus sandwichensis]
MEGQEAGNGFRLEKLEADAQHGTQKLVQINSKWGLAGELRVPQELWELLEQQRQECEQLLARKNQLIRELQEELKARDELYEQTLRDQAEATRVLLERMEEQTRSMLRAYRHHLRHIEKTFEEERREMLTSNRSRWNEAMRVHNEQEVKPVGDLGIAEGGKNPLGSLEFLRRKVDQALDFEQQLNELQDASTETHDGLKWQLEEDVERLERKLRQMKGMYHLNQVKLDYNLDVLRQLDIENSTLRSLQKRKINRFRTTLELLKDKMAKQEVKFQEEKQSLELELERVVGQFQETRDRMRHLARSRVDRFRQVWMVNEEEAKALIREVLDADRIIHVQQLGMAWEEPQFWFMDNVGPLGDVQEKREAMELATKLLEGRGRAARPRGFFPGLRNPPLPQDPGQPGGRSGRAERIPLPARFLSQIPAIQVDHVLTILREFLQEFPKLRDEGPPRELQDVRDNSKDGEYWEAMTHILPQRKLKLWDALGAALVEYHKVLTRRSELFSEATALQRQNTELGMLLEEYLGSAQGGCP